MIPVLKILYSLPILGMIFGSVWYVPFRLCRLIGSERIWPRYAAMAFIVLLIAVPIGRFIKSTSEVIDIGITAAGVLLGFHILTAILLLILDALRLVIHLPDRPIAKVVVSTAVLVTVISVWYANAFKVTEVEIPIDGLKQDVTLMHISDVHIGHQRGRAYLERIVKETNRHQPELVLINGDLVDADSALEPGVLSPLGQFNAPAYFTTGNHESYVDTERALSIIAGHGIRILHNEVVETHEIQLVGLDYMNADENTFDMHAVNGFTIKEELPRLPISEGKPAILMHHSPVGLEYVSAGGIKLMLSGHTHGGQMFPGTLLASWLFRLRKGLHLLDGTYFFVSQGAGTYIMRMRLGSSNEINLIRLRTSK